MKLKKEEEYYTTFNTFIDEYLLDKKGEIMPDLNDFYAFNATSSGGGSGSSNGGNGGGKGIGCGGAAVALRIILLVIYFIGKFSS